MPRPVARAKDRAVDAAWPDLRDEIMWEVAVLIDGKPREDIPDGQPACCLCRFLRYHIYPYDKTFWGHLRDPVYIIFTLVSLIPISGLCSLIYLFVFLIIDRGDEHQLLQFILQFKGAQFLSHGVIRTITGFFIYVGCVTAAASDRMHSCHEHGPGVAGSIEVILGGWALQVLLLWTAALLLPCSQDKGRSELTGILEFEQTSRMKRKGGAIRYMLVWDMLCFLACCSVLVWAATTRPMSFGQAYKDWAVKHTFYACQVVYGYLSMPFFFFTLPLLQAVLTHTVPTGYDRRGICRKWCGPAKKRDDQDEDELVTVQESSSLQERMRILLLGGTVEVEDLGRPAGT